MPGDGTPGLASFYGGDATQAAPAGSAGGWLQPKLQLLLLLLPFSTENSCKSSFFFLVSDLEKQTSDLKNHYRSITWIFKN